MITLAALNHRTETGTGQYVDFSMAEALSASLPEALLEYQMTGEEPEPIGNRDRFAAPNGVYKCRGEDSWIAIEVYITRETGRLLCSAIERTDLLEDPGLSTPDGRRSRESELDAAISEWTAQMDEWDAFERLQRAGVPCGPSLDMGRLHSERQLNDGGYLTAGRVFGWQSERVLPTLPWRLDGQRTQDVRPAPVLGQDSDYVYRELLGLGWRR